MSLQMFASNLCCLCQLLAITKGTQHKVSENPAMGGITEQIFHDCGDGKSTVLSPRRLQRENVVSCWQCRRVSKCTQAWQLLMEIEVVMLQRYSNEVLEDLLGRFEAPREADRWDSPLFTLKPSTSNSSSMQDQLDQVVAFLQPMAVQDVASAGQAPCAPRALRPTIATAQPMPQDAGWLQDIDATAQAVLQRLANAQSAVGPGLAVGRIDVCSSHAQGYCQHEKACSPKRLYK
jgi:hypothetical protein